MSNKWKYRIELENKSIFDCIEKKSNITIPKDLKEFIIENNASTPEKYNFLVKGSEKVFGSVLSFNKEKNTDTVFIALECINDLELLPFAIDPFGNYICYSLKENSIKFWDHETDKSIFISDSLADFLNSLY